MTDNEDLVHHRRRPRHGRRFRQGRPGRRARVVATGRNTDAVAEALGDVGRPAGRQARRHQPRMTPRRRSQAAVERFGRIDVLVNNAANFYAGYFEELTPEQIERQLAASLIGPMNVTRAVLPVMRKQRSGHIISISSTAGLVGFEFGTAYAASKFGLEGWMESLRPRSRRSASTPPSSTRGSSARSSSRRSRRPTPSRPSTTTPSAARRSASAGRARTASRPATRPSSPRRW